MTTAGITFAPTIQISGDASQQTLDAIKAVAREEFGRFKSERSLYAVQRLLRARADKPFRWGTHDCAMLAFDAVFMLTGRDPARDLRGQWDDALGAMRKLRELGGWDGVAQRFGPEIAPADAEPGDVLMLDRSACECDMAAHGALAVRWGDGGVAQGADGLVAVPMSSVRRAWRAA